MIKDFDKKNKQKQKKTLAETIMEYARTMLISFLVAVVITTCLTIQARKSMIKNLYIKVEDNKKLDEQIAKHIIAQSDLTKNLATQNYTVCMNVGNLYEAAKDYTNAQIAYQAAILRAKRGVYTPYYKLSSILIAQAKFDEAESVINSVTDLKNRGLIKFKTRAFIEAGDKYYSLGKFLKAARSYERAKYYYERFSKRDKIIEESIKKRIVNAYSEAATVVVQQGYNSDAVSFLKKAEQYAPNDFHIKYKLAIIYSDLDPIKSIEYFDPLLKKMPQYIDYSTYNKALLKASNISDLEGNPTKAKYYRYKSHSIDLLIQNKVVYKNDIDIIMESFEIKKFLFRYHLKGKYKFKNTSHEDIFRLFADFELREGDEIKESYTVKCVTKDNPLFSNGGETDSITVNFGKKIFTKKELSQYVIDVYLYKDEKFKTLIGTFAIPEKSIKNAKSDTPEF
ncbi:hypothetical protein IKQ21_07540 [bacterium]|nr:hypothetical protein [bacterium]